MKKLTMFFLTALMLCAGTAQAKEKKVKAKRGTESTLALIERVNDTWQANNKPQCRAFWDNAAYFTGNMEAYKLTGKAQYLVYSDEWCRHNQWMGARSDNKSAWKYKNYGEGDDYVLFGDWQICFQTYIDHYRMNPDDYKVARAKEVMSYECAMPDNKFWWWADALYMVMPVMTKMYLITGDKMYLDKLYQNFSYADSLMYDPEAQLYFRDAKYIFPKVKTKCDGKSFWARGDGWVLAGLAKVLADMPVDYEHRDVFLTRFKTLAEGVARCQQKEGYWSRSMLCEADAPGYETSGTAFFTYGLLWGVNHGILDKATYAPVIDKAWTYLTQKALQPDGTIGYVQPIGEKPDPTRTVDAHSQAPFGTGAWLLAACEMVRYQDGSVQPTGTPVSVDVSNPANLQRHSVIEVDAKVVFQKLGLSGGRQFVVKNAFGHEVPSQLTYDGNILFEAYVAPNGTAHFTIEKGVPAVYKNVAYGRVYPERLDDMAWENDKVAYRFYGPALQKRGEKAYGLDVWLKSTPDLVMEDRYHDESIMWPIRNKLSNAGFKAEAKAYEDSKNYHIDHGYGLDCYTVGPTLGGGTSALVQNGELLLPYSFKTCEILDNGPLRFTAKMTYNPTKVGDAEVTEVRLLRQDVGTHLTKMQIDYQGLTQTQEVAAGIVVHSEDTHSVLADQPNGIIAYADPTENLQQHNFQIYLGCIFPDGLKAARTLPIANSKGNAAHLVGITDLQPNRYFTYYLGSGWSKYDVPNFEVWQSLLKQYSQDLKQPLATQLK